MIPFTRIDGEKVYGATEAQVREAVAAGKMVIAVDDAGMAMQIDKATMARLDAMDAANGRPPFMSKP